MKRELPTLQINWSQVITSLLIGAVFGAIAIIRLSDTQTVVIAGHTKSIEELKGSTMSREVFEQHALQQTIDVSDIKTTLRDLNGKIDRLLLK